MPDTEIEQPDQEQQSTRPFWSGTITFGLVSIPVSLFPANRQARVSLRMLSPEGKPLARRYYAPATGHELGEDDMLRGYEIERDKYVVVTDEELERLAPEKSRDIDLQRFVEADKIPPMYFERSYFLTPAGGSSKAYRLLAAIMEQTKRAGIATFIMRGKEYLVAILAENGILRAETLRFSDEIRSPEDVGLPAGEADAAHTRRFAAAIEKLSEKTLAMDELKDDSGERLLALAKRKESQHKDVVRAPGAVKHEKVIDILSVLKQSLTQAKSQREGEAQTKPKSDGDAGLKSKSRAELYEKAKSLDIPGRSAMSKDELIEAIQRVA